MFDIYCNYSINNYGNYVKTRPEDLFKWQFNRETDPEEHNNHLPNLQTIYVTLISPWLEFAGFSVTSVRHKSKSSRSKNLGGKRNTVGKAYGIKRNDGCFVHKGEILVNQCGLRFYPGENVSVLTELHPPYIIKIMFTWT